MDVVQMAIVHFLPVSIVARSSLNRRLLTLTVRKIQLTMKHYTLSFVIFHQLQFLCPFSSTKLWRIRYDIHLESFPELVGLDVVDERIDARWDKEQDTRNVVDAER
jgi:hypothetical protein